MRLIDADKLKEYLGNRYMPEVKEDIDAQPTAFDVEEVVERLEQVAEPIGALVFMGDDTRYIDCNHAVVTVRETVVGTERFCEWKYDESFEYATSECGSMDTHRIDFRSLRYCPYCSKKIEIKTRK